MRNLQLNHTMSEFDSLKKVEKFARHWLYITIRNAQKRGSYLFSGYRKATNMIQSDHHHQPNNGVTSRDVLTLSKGPPKRRPSPRIPNELLLLNFPVRMSHSEDDVAVDGAIHSQPPSSEQELKSFVQNHDQHHQKQDSFQLKDDSLTATPQTLDTHENVRAVEENIRDGDPLQLIEEIDKIKNVLEEFETNWTPIYELEKDKRKYLRELIEMEDDLTTIQELTSELTHLEKRAKTYLKFKREELPKLIEQLHQLVSSCDPALLQ